MDSNFLFCAFLSLRSSSVFSIPRSRSAEGTDAESGTEAISLKRKESGGLPIAVGCTRSKTGRVPCLHICWAEQCEPDILLYRSPTNAFPWRKPDAIHRRYLETSPRHCPGRNGRGAPVALRRQGSRPPRALWLQQQWPRSTPSRLCAVSTRKSVTAVISCAATQ